ncbi:MAG: response regulator transcription factor [Bacteroidetes bacterium]|nr:response regulator transcription factor [Bacteroidota bacterium]
MEIKVCLFDDSRAITDSFEVLLASDPEFSLAGVFPDASNAIQRVKDCQANLIIMDIDMPGTNGIEGVKALRTAFPELVIIMFTVFEDDDKIFRSICAGANGYLLKKTEPAKILQALHEARNGGAPMSPGIARRVLSMFSENLSKKPSESYDLTQRETEILRSLTRGLSYKMIAAECGISFETVRSHIKNIYSKLHVASMTEAVAKALNEGLV